MKDQRLIRLRLDAEDDPELEGWPFKLLSKLISARYVDPHWTGGEFCIEPTWALKWSGLTRKQSFYLWLRQLIERGYLIAGGLRGCPPHRQYEFRFKGAVKSTFEGAVKSTFEGADKRTDKGAGKPTPHISIPFRKELSQRESNGAAAAAKAGGEDDRGSLRSQRELAAQARREAELLAALKRSTA